MSNPAFHVVRIGVGITFLWIGVLIFQQPAVWGGYLQPWAADLLPLPIAQAMLGAAALDVALGVFLLLNVFTWLAALIGALHVVAILIVSGITDITVRDIAIAAAAIALVIDSLPEGIIQRFKARLPTNVTRYE